MYASDLHLCVEYSAGIGHIEGREDGRLLVTFYGRRVQQLFAGSLQQARFALRRMSQGPLSDAQRDLAALSPHSFAAVGIRVRTGESNEAILQAMPRLYDDAGQPL